MTKIEKNRFRKLVAGMCMSAFSTSDSLVSMSTDMDAIDCTTSGSLATSHTAMPSLLPQQLTGPHDSDVPDSSPVVTVQASSLSPQPSRSTFCLHIRVFYPLFKPLELMLDEPGTEFMPLARVAAWVCQSCNVEESITAELYASEGYPISQSSDCRAHAV